jgi:hypothetical protein
MSSVTSDVCRGGVVCFICVREPSSTATIFTYSVPPDVPLQPAGRSHTNSNACTNRTWRKPKLYKMGSVLPDILELTSQLSLEPSAQPAVQCYYLVNISKVYTRPATTAAQAVQCTEPTACCQASLRLCKPTCCSNKTKTPQTQHIHKATIDVQCAWLQPATCQPWLVLTMQLRSYTTARLHRRACTLHWAAHECW